MKKFNEILKEWNAEAPNAEMQKAVEKLLVRKIKVAETAKNKDAKREAKKALRKERCELEKKVRQLEKIKTDSKKLGVELNIDASIGIWNARITELVENHGVAKHPPRKEKVETKDRK